MGEVLQGSSGEAQAEEEEGVGVMTHQCHAVGCSETVPPAKHMCARHWRMVPEVVQKLIWRHYRQGQEIDKRPSVEYLATAFVSISCVALKEGRTPPSLSSSPKAEGQQSKGAQGGQG